MYELMGDFFIIVPQNHYTVFNPLINPRLQWNLSTADTIASLERCLLQRGVRYREVNFNEKLAIGSKNGVRYKACSL